MFDVLIWLIPTLIVLGFCLLAYVAWRLNVHEAKQEVDPMSGDIIKDRSP